MSFGRRLAVFFVLIVLVPTLALAGMMLIVSEDSRQGKADARLAAGLDTALALYDQKVAEAEPKARALAADPGLGQGLRDGDSAELQSFARAAAAQPGVAGVEVLGPADNVEARAGGPDAIAFAQLDLEAQGAPQGKLLVSVTTASEFAADVRRLTRRELVVNGEGSALAGTVDASAPGLEAGETTDVDLGGDQYRAHLLSLNEQRDESVLLLGPRTDEGLLAIERPVAALLAGFLLLAIVLAYVLARALTGLHSQVAQQAVTDSLTGLSNRRFLDQQLEREVERAVRFGHELSLLILDADDFKEINDQHGHQVGDAVLITVADVVRSTTRTIDITARYGGDELALVLLETGSHGAAILADRLRENVRAAKIRGLERGSVTISVGVATLPDSADDVRNLIGAADQALLVAKRAGKDQTRSAPGRPPAAANGHGKRPQAPRRAGRRRSAG
jgi:diguanylate cyclase (GGDEF)-like protein